MMGAPVKCLPQATLEVECGGTWGGGGGGGRHWEDLYKQYLLYLGCDVKGKKKKKIQLPPLSSS